MILIEFGANLCNLGVFCLVTIIVLKALDHLRFLILKDRMPDYSKEEDPDYIS